MNISMRTRFVFSLVLVAALAYSAVWAQAATPQERVRVKSVVGKAEVKSAKSPKWRPVRVNMPIKTGWDVRTYVESSLELRYESGTVIKIGENSVVTLSKLSKETKNNPGNSHIKVATGEVWGNVKKLMNKKSKFSFETPTAVASIRGTVKRTVSRGGKDTIECIEGSVEVTNKGSRRSVMITDKQRAVISKGSSEINVTTIAETTTPWTATETVGDMTLTITTPQSGTVVEESPVTIKGTTTKGATVVIGEAKATAGEDGTFSIAAELVPGVNDITITATGEETSVSTKLSLEYMPKLTMTVKGVTDGMEVGVDELAVEVEVSEGATYSLMLNKAATESPLKLKPGNNVLTVTATDAFGATLTEEFTVKYKKGEALFVTITSPSDGEQVTSAAVDVSGTTVPEATLTVNGMSVKPNEAGMFTYGLALQGAGPEYKIEAKATYEDQEASEEITVTFVEGIDLQVTQPANGQTVDTTTVKIAGTVTAGATVTINGEPATVSGTIFNHRMYIPDEEGEYTIEIVAEYQGAEVTKEINVVYEPVRIPLTLDLISPKDNEEIISSPIKVIGKTSPQATVMVNGRRAGVAPDGRFNADIFVTEQNVGDMQIEIVAENEDEDMAKAVDVVIGIKSPQINTSIPQLIVSGQSMRASRTDDLVVQVLDRTPNDEITLMVTLNGGAVDEYTMQPNSSERIKLEEGKNIYEVKARDLAGNMSNVVRGERYYLPGPLDIEINEPPSNPYLIDDLPPPPPSGVDINSADIEIEIEDQIGDVPETILYVRVKGAAGDVQLSKSPNYIYTGKVKVKRGRNLFTIEVEDIAGNKKSETLSITIED